jgi:DNA topoisomerase-1
MSNKIIFIESAGKIKKITEILDKKYIIKASFGHIQDLDKKTLSIDIENNFTPIYVTNPDKIKLITEFKTLINNASEIILASDEDREGEAIAYSLATVLKLKNPKRITFHEITKTAIKKALENPREIDYNMVYAQQTRRLLDRLMGYKISPILWKYLPNAQSAGRVQSVVVKIIVDKETEINKSISNPFLKTTGDFLFLKNKIISTLNYNFDNEINVKNFYNNINKKTDILINKVDNKLSTRKPSHPFITSTLQQEASTKLHLPIKKTMEIAQKLYEGGHITYMRTDCPNISEEAITSIEKYIIENYGEEYSDPKNYKSKNINAQEAHECIRPTNININELKLEDKDLNKLYLLIWKRTIASQMSNAKINIQTIYIDLLNNNKTILLFDNIKSYFISILENIEFQGYLIVYDNRDLTDSENIIGKLEIKENDKLIFNKIKTTEEYTKLPLRYNEAGLIKFLEKNGIGRPSTYSSIISKVIDRKYVEIKNIDGTTKISKIIEINNKLIIKEDNKEITIGKEQKKIVPTEMGTSLNNFMNTNFEPIMQIEFTANLETFLDKIAIGKANWVTVLKSFYDMFNPIVEKLNNNVKNLKQIKDVSITDILLGSNENGIEIYKGVGKFGPYVKIMNNDKWKYASIKNDDINLNDAIKLLEFPKEIGKIGDIKISIYNGNFGYYIKYNDKNISIKDKNIDEIDIKYIKSLISDNKSFKIKNKIIYIKNGKYGYYLEVNTDKKKENINIPIKYDITKITINDIQDIINSKK